MPGMAITDIRTVTDDAADALRALDEAERELTRWRAQLERLALTGQLGDAFQARRCARIVCALAEEARAHTQAAVWRAGLPADFPVAQ